MTYDVGNDLPFPIDLTPEQFDHLRILQTIGRTLYRGALEIDWNTYGHKDSHTARCWFGWYCTYTGAELTDDYCGMYTNHHDRAAQKHFGLDPDTLNALFQEPPDYSSWSGPDAKRVLVGRMALLDEIVNNANIVAEE